MYQRFTIIRSLEEATFTVCEVSRYYVEQLTGDREPRIIACCGVQSLQSVRYACVVFERAGALTGTPIAGSSPKPTMRINMDRDQQVR